MNAAKASISYIDYPPAEGIFTGILCRLAGYLVDERNLKPSTIDNIHTVLHQVLQIAVDDEDVYKRQ